MKKTISLILFLLFIISPHYTISGKKAVNVLLLNSYHQGLKWTDDITAAVRATIEPKTDAEIFVEDMDTKRVFSKAHFRELAALYKEKYKGIKLDVIIASDDNAFDFLLQNKNAIFGSVPVVFCGVNYFTDKKLAGHPDFTGVVEAFDIKSTIDIALKQNPKTQEIVVINDRTVTGKANKKIIEAIIPGYKNRVNFRFIDNVPMSVLLSKVGSLPKNDIILLMSFNRDALGDFYSYSQSIELISKYSHIPMYGIWDFYLGSGIVGGVLTNGYSQGSTAARMALRVLAGEKISEVPVVKKSPNVAMFDYKELKKFGIKKSTLPKGSVLINAPPRFLKISKNVFWGAIVGLLFLGSISLILALNIAGRRRAEAALRISEKKYRRLIETASDAILIIDNGSGRIIEINRQAELLFGYKREEFQEVTWEKLIIREQQKLFRRIISAENDILYTESAEFSILTKFGKEIPAELSASTVEVGGKKLVMAIFRDISRRKAAEAELTKANLQLEKKVKARTRDLEEQSRLLKKQNIEILKADRMKDQFLANVSHELRTPLNSILGFSQVLLNDMDGKLNKRQNEDVSIIHKNGLHLLQLINDILDISRIKSGKVNLVLEKINPVIPIDEVIESLNSVAKDKGLYLKSHAPLKDLFIYADKLRFKQIIFNLAANALKFTDKGGVDVFVEEDNDRIVIKVKDTGPGIPPDELPNIFAAFYQVRAKGKSKAAGTGLGLAITKNYAEMMDAEVYVKSEPGLGSEFSVVFNKYRPGA